MTLNRSSFLGNEEEISGDYSFLFHLGQLLSGELPLVFHYQPIVDLSRGVVTGYEALVRFPPAMGSAPDVCLANAGRLGRRLDLEQAVSLAALRGRELLPANCFLSVNVSPAFLLSDRWQQVLLSSADLAGIVIEITEEESITDYEKIRCCLAQVRALGGSIAVDDAGAGYASLKHVVEMKPSFIKLDRMFIADCHSEPAKSALIEMIGRAANRLDAWIVAEGIETENELDELMRLGVPLGQGYFLGRPSPVMQPISDAKAADIRSRIQVHSSSGSLQKHLQPCPARPSAECAQKLLTADLTLEAVVITDKWNRPVEIVHRHPIAGLRRILDIMKIQVFSDPAEVLHRALTRPAITRFDPFAVIDNRGEFQGIVSIDRLMRSLIP